MEVGGYSSAVGKMMVCSIMEAALTETLVLAAKSLACLLVMPGSLTNDANKLLESNLMDKRFPIEELNRRQQPVPENKDGSDSEDGEDDEDGVEDDDDAADEDFSGEEGGDDDDDDDEGDPEDDAEANGEGGSDDDEDDDNDDDGDEEKGEEEDEEEDEEEEELQPPAKRKK